ncbi:MAG: hypothetical protein M3171_03425 [Actinomycetota bacterium]|nr:hypothetical protein [Actinomycetota bacterium]
MVETPSSVATDLATVRTDLVGWARRTSVTARRNGAALGAVGNGASHQRRTFQRTGNWSTWWPRRPGAP